jgi:hypothetical protein
MAVVRRLCSEEFAGRKAGAAGGGRAADWLAGEFRRIGLQAPEGAPRFRHGFTMPVSLLSSRWDRKAKLVAPNSREAVLIEYPRFRGEGFCAAAEAVFAGWGIARRDQGWDDYQGRDVRGKYVVYWEGAPAPGLEREQHARWRDARARGARGCLVLSRAAGRAAGLECPIPDFPVLRLDPGTARRLLKAPAPAPRELVRRALPPLRVEIPRARDPARPVANIVGMIPGTDPILAQEVVILSAHYDHLGASSLPPVSLRLVSRTASQAAGVRERSAPVFYPGADDDASGVAVVLGVARALRALDARPRRTVMFILWTAEECGLLGSRAYVDRPVAPLEQTRFVLQVEMVGAGRPDTLVTSPARFAPAGRVSLAAAAERLGLSLAGDGCRGMSDHLPFARRGVPALVVTTAGEHPDYHTVRDTPDRLRPAGIENATRLCALAVWREANRDEMNRGARRVPFLRDAREGQPRHCVLCSAHTRCSSARG